MIISYKQEAFTKHHNSLLVYKVWQVTSIFSQLVCQNRFTSFSSYIFNKLISAVETNIGQPWPQRIHPQLELTKEAINSIEFCLLRFSPSLRP